MSLPRAIMQTVEGVADVISVDHMTEAELQALAETTRAVDDELLERIAARCGHLPVSHPWPDAPSPRVHPLAQRVVASFPKGPAR